MSDDLHSSNGEAATHQADDGWLIVQQPKSGTCDELDGKAKGPAVVQQRGRFNVTSEDLDVGKVITQQQGVTLPPPSSTDDALAQHVNSMFPPLLSILHKNIIQRDIILNLLKQISGGDAIGIYDGEKPPLTMNLTEKSLLDAAQDREKELLREITELQWRLIRTQEGPSKYKTEHA